MPRVIHPQICANCQHCDPFGDSYDNPGEECGSCRKKDNEIIYLDDEKCDEFSACKNPRVRAEDWWC